MRMLLLDGVEPDFQLQKSLDTFEKRDHLRIWARDREIGRQQGLGIGCHARSRCGFSVRPFGFTHQIQDNVDLERDQVVSDLAFTGCVDSVAYVSRPETVRTSGEPYRKGVFTDSRVAVVTLNSCRNPTRKPFREPADMPQAPKMVRWIRRIDSHRAQPLLAR